MSVVTVLDARNSNAGRLVPQEREFVVETERQLVRLCRIWRYSAAQKDIGKYNLGLGHGQNSRGRLQPGNRSSAIILGSEPTIFSIPTQVKP